MEDGCASLFSLSSSARRTPPVRKPTVPVLSLFGACPRAAAATTVTCAVRERRFRSRTMRRTASRGACEAGRQNQQNAPGPMAMLEEEEGGPSSNDESEDEASVSPSTSASTLCGPAAVPRLNLIGAARAHPASGKKVGAEHSRSEYTCWEHN